LPMPWLDFITEPSPRRTRRRRILSRSRRFCWRVAGGHIDDHLRELVNVAGALGILCNEKVLYHLERSSMATGKIKRIMSWVFRPNIVRILVITASATLAVLSIRHVIADLRAPDSSRGAGAFFYGLAAVAFILQIIISVRRIARSVRVVRARMLAEIAENSD
jgi:hypothetical protein